MEIMTSVSQGDVVVTDLFRAAWHFSWIYSNQSLCALARDRSEIGMPRTLPWLLRQTFSYKGSVDRQTLGAEYIKRSQWHIERPVSVLHSTWCQKSGFSACQVMVESTVYAWCEIDGHLSHFHPCLCIAQKKNNYALFPLIKLLISADGFRNMKQNSE